MIALLLILLSHVTPSVVLRDSVDLVEVNHYYDEHGKRVFEQLIFYDWSDEENRFQVRAWRALKEKQQLPVRDWRRGEWFVIWLDGEKLRRVIARAKFSSWTQFDPEFMDRQVWPKDKRRGLRK